MAVGAGLTFGWILVRFPSPRLTLDTQSVPIWLLWCAAICGASGVVLATVSLAGSMSRGRRPTQDGGITTNVVSLLAFTAPLTFVSIVARDTEASWAPALFAVMIWAAVGVGARWRS